MGEQAADAVERLRRGHHRLEGEPFVEDKRVIAVAVVEIRQRLASFRHRIGDHDRKRRRTVGHVVGVAVMRDHASDRIAFAGGGGEV